MSAPEKGAAYQELVAGREFDILDIETTHKKATRTGSFRRVADARRAAAARVSRARKADPVRTPADIELRPPQSVRAFRYQLYRRPETG